MNPLIDEQGLDDCGECGHPLDKHEGVAIGDNGSFICWEEDCQCNIRMSARLIRAAERRAHDGDG